MTRKSKEPNQHIKPMLLEKLLRRDAELKNAHLVKRVEELEWKQQVAAQGAKMRKLESLIASANTEFNQVVSEVEKAYNISLKDYAYDTDTGRLTKL